MQGTCILLQVSWHLTGAIQQPGAVKPHLAVSLSYAGGSAALCQAGTLVHLQAVQLHGIEAAATLGGLQRCSTALCQFIWMLLTLWWPFALPSPPQAKTRPRLHWGHRASLPMPRPQPCPSRLPSCAGTDEHSRASSPWLVFSSAGLRQGYANAGGGEVSQQTRWGQKERDEKVN